MSCLGAKKNLNAKRREQKYHPAVFMYSMYLFNLQELLCQAVLPDGRLGRIGNTVVNEIGKYLCLQELIF